MEPITYKSKVVIAVIACVAVLQATISFAEVNPYAAAVLKDQPISFHRFNDTDGETASDATGNGHTAKLLGVQVGQASAYSNLALAFSFNGTNSHVRIPANVAYKVGKGDFSVELWFTCQSSLKARSELFKFKGEGKDFGFFKPHGNSNLIATARPTQPFQAQTDPFSLGVWHHAVYVRRAGVDHWFIDGALSGTATGNSLAMDMNVDIVIGADHYYDPNRIVPDSIWKGQIDELAIYGHALNSDRVRTHFDAAVSDSK